MPIAVKLFAGLGAAFGPETSLDLEPPIAVAGLIASLAERGVWTPGARVAVNHRFACPDDTIQAGDEVAVIPPVSGG